jgi:hypothetical protein
LSEPVPQPIVDYDEVAQRNFATFGLILSVWDYLWRNSP